MQSCEYCSLQTLLRPSQLPCSSRLTLRAPTLGRAATGADGGAVQVLTPALRLHREGKCMPKLVQPQRSALQQQTGSGLPSNMPCFPSKEVYAVCSPGLQLLF